MMLNIAADGTVRTLYTEAIPLNEIGSCTIRRASHVEPDTSGRWFAEMIGGPVLGPFTTRSAALAAEVEYLETHTL